MMPIGVHVLNANMEYNTNITRDVMMDVRSDVNVEDEVRVLLTVRMTGPGMFQTRQE